MSNFNTYSNLLSPSAYSLSYFNSLTFWEASGINYPPLAPLGSVISWVFVDNIPISADTCQVMPDDIVPHIDELLTIIREAHKAYTWGKHAVYIHILTNEQQTNYLYHFSKVGVVQLQAFNKNTF